MIAFVPVVAWLLALTAVGERLVAVAGIAGLAPLFAVWLLALPFLLGRLRPLLWSELGVALALFGAVGCVHMIEEVYGTRGIINVLLLGLGVSQLLWHRRETGAVLRSPVTAAFLVFVAQQLMSGWLARTDDVIGMVRDRLLMLVLTLLTAHLVCRRGGARLAAALILFATLMSLPVMLQELAEPIRGLTEDERAGGFYAQANVAGIMLSYGVAAIGVLYLLGVVAPLTAVALYVPAFVAIFCTASRGALINAVAAVAVSWAAALNRRFGARGIATAAVSIVAMVMVMAPLSDAIGRAANRVDDASQANVERLQGVLLLLGGSSAGSDEVASHDSGRLLLAQEAIETIGARPLFGYGTANFAHEVSKRSHVEFLEIVAENGLVGAVFYVALLVILVRALLRMDRRTRLAATVMLTPWLVSHFHNHNLHEAFYLNVPLGFAAGLAARRELAPAVGA